MADSKENKNKPMSTSTGTGSAFAQTIAGAKSSNGVSTGASLRERPGGGLSSGRRLNGPGMGWASSYREACSSPGGGDKASFFNDFKDDFDDSDLD